MRSMQIGLALGSGAARGLAHIGVLQGLVEAGIRPAAIAGTSIGALVGVLYARSLDPAQVREHVLRVIRGPVFRRICSEYWEAVRQARGSAGLVIVPAVQHLDWFDFHRAEEAIERGVEAVRRVAQQLLALNGNGQARAAPSSGSNPSGRPLVIDGVLRRNPPGAPARGEAV
jgi:predicted acylesterase/phospholipase RssA